MLVYNVRYKRKTKAVSGPASNGVKSYENQAIGRGHYKNILIYDIYSKGKVRNISNMIMINIRWRCFTFEHGFFKVTIWLKKQLSKQPQHRLVSKRGNSMFNFTLFAIKNRRKMFDAKHIRQIQLYVLRVRWQRTDHFRKEVEDGHAGESAPRGARQ